MEEDTEIKSFAEGDTTRRYIRALHHRWTRGPSVANTALSIYWIELQMTTPAEKKTLFYKLFSMSKREWDLEVKLHQQKLDRRQRDYFLSFRKHSDKEKK